jgi:hypothetical protein
MRISNKREANLIHIRDALSTPRQYHYSENEERGRTSHESSVILAQAK